MSTERRPLPAAVLAAALALVCAGGAAAADTPLSAIDWLTEPSGGTAEEPTPPAGSAEALDAEAPDTAALGEARAGRALPPGLARPQAPVPVPTPVPRARALAPAEPIVVTPLAPAVGAAAGVLPPSVTGLPREIWRGSDAGRLVRLVEGLPDPGLPAVDAMVEALMLAEADLPADADAAEAEALLGARVDLLIDRGALDAAAALLDRAGLDAPERRRRAFDVALLTGRENEACRAAGAVPRSEGDHARRVFCLLRAGDWGAGALTFDAARALGFMDPVEEALLAAFIDDELDAAPLPAPPRRPSPLAFRLFETLGAPLPTGSLPVAFARADLRLVAGWKAQVEAAERLARAGAIEGNRLMALMTEREPSASGGVWDRVAAIQALDAALAERDPAAVSAALPPAWDAMAEGGTLAVLAPVVAPRLGGLALDGAAEGLALRLALLGGDHAGPAAPDGDREAGALLAVAAGEAPASPRGAIAEAVARGFDDAPPPERLVALARADRLGEALLLAAGDLAAGADGDPGRLPGALRFLRAAGLEDTARRAALQLLILRG